jgi:uncharacterized alkaline shock family protein YloU
VSESRLTVERSVVDDTIRLAAEEVPGVLRVGRGGPPWRGWLRPTIRTHRQDGLVSVRLWVVARPGHDLVDVGREVRAAIAAAAERLLGLEVGPVTVVVDGVGT